MPLRGEVWAIDLNPVQGHEQAKIRPCVIISNDMMNSKMELSIVIPVTGTPWHTRSGKLSPAMVEILPPEGGLEKPSYTMAFQVRTVSHKRFTKKLGILTAKKLSEIVNSVKEIIDE